MLDYAIGGVLMQFSHPMAFEGRKLNDTERQYLVHEKEMIAMVYYLWMWCHYLLGSHFTIFTHNVAESCFAT